MRWLLSVTMVWKSLEWTSRALIHRGQQVRRMLAALEEAAGMWRRESRSIAESVEEWHQFLGFAPCSLPSRKRPIEDIANQADNRSKRLRSNDYTIIETIDTALGGLARSYIQTDQCLKVARVDMESAVQRKSRIEEFFYTQEGDVQQAHYMILTTMPIEYTASTTMFPLLSHD